MFGGLITGIKPNRFNEYRKAADKFITKKNVVVILGGGIDPTVHLPRNGNSFASVEDKSRAFVR